MLKNLIAALTALAAALFLCDSGYRMAQRHKRKYVRSGFFRVYDLRRGGCPVSAVPGMVREKRGGETL